MSEAWSIDTKGLRERTLATRRPAGDQREVLNLLGDAPSKVHTSNEFADPLLPFRRTQALLPRAPPLVGR